MYFLFAYLWCILPGYWDFNSLPTNGFSIKPLKYSRGKCVLGVMVFQETYPFFEPDRAMFFQTPLLAPIAFGKELLC